MPTAEENAFPSRLLRFSTLEAAQNPPVDPGRINQHLEGQRDSTRGMTDAEIAELLNDPFATLVLRRGIFPATLTELLDALNTHNEADEGLPDVSSFLIAEGGQIPFQAGVDKGVSRLLVVRGRRNSPELMISALLGPAANPRATGVLLEVIAWDPTNRTFHFYQLQEGGWFWCGQSDMALVSPTRGHGAFDSHVNGYPVMKELKSPWVHWNGPSLQIAETAYSPTAPIVTDRLFLDKDTALNFEVTVIRPLARRWNGARFAKAVDNGVIAHFDQYARQLLEATTVNLISTHKEWSQIDTGRDLDDIPATFFCDIDSLVGAIGVPADVPPLALSRERYRALVEQHDLRVVGGGVNVAGDVPFCFTVPERAFEDVLALQALLQNGVISPRLAAALLMVDFSNPLDSLARAALMTHMPQQVAASKDALDTEIGERIAAAAANTPQGSPERQFAANWQLGPDGWRDAYADRIESYLAAVASRLDSDDGADDIFRLAESRRRQFRKRKLSEFGLTLPRAVGIADDKPVLDMDPDGQIRPRQA